MLDQEIAAALAIAQKRTDLLKRSRIDLPALGRARRPTPAGVSAVLRLGCLRQLRHGHSLFF
jgi:hypothetical protein